MLAVFLTNIAEEEEEEEEEEEAARVEFFFRAKEAGAMADRAVSEVNIALRCVGVGDLVRNSYDVNAKFSWLKMKAEETRKRDQKIRARSTAALHTNDVLYTIYNVYKCEKTTRFVLSLLFYARV